MQYVRYSNDHVAHGDTEAKQEGRGSSSSRNACMRSFKRKVNKQVISRCGGDQGCILRISMSSKLAALP